MSKIRITIQTERGEQTMIEVDAHVAGYLSGGAFRGIEELYDGHGDLKRPRDKEIADDLVTGAETFDKVFRQEVLNSPQSK